VTQFKAFSRPSKKNGVFPDDVTAPNRVDPDLSWRSFSDETCPAVSDTRFVRQRANLSNDLPESFRRAARRIFLQPVMNFHDLSVELRPESFGGLLRQPEKEIYPHAEIRGQKQRGPLRRALKLLPLVCAVAGCADHRRLGSPGALVSNQNRRFRLTHVNHDVAPIDQFSDGIAAS
jgi:hypothetical protein